MERLKLKKTLSITLLSLFVFLAVSCGGSSGSAGSSGSTGSSGTTGSAGSSGSSGNKSNQSTQASFTCKNCGGHSYKNHETVTNMKVCQSCGIGN